MQTILLAQPWSAKALKASAEHEVFLAKGEHDSAVYHMSTCLIMQAVILMIAADGLVSCANSLQEGYQSQTIPVLTASWLPC